MRIYSSAAIILGTACLASAQAQQHFGSHPGSIDHRALALDLDRALQGSQSSQSVTSRLAAAGSGLRGAAQTYLASSGASASTEGTASSTGASATAGGIGSGGFIDTVQDVATTVASNRIATGAGVARAVVGSGQEVMQAYQEYEARCGAGTAWYLEALLQAMMDQQSPSDPSTATTTPGNSPTGTAITPTPSGGVSVNGATGNPIIQWKARAIGGVVAQRARTYAQVLPCPPSEVNAAGTEQGTTPAQP